MIEDNGKNTTEDMEYKRREAKRKYTRMLLEVRYKNIKVREEKRTGIHEKLMRIYQIIRERGENSRERIEEEVHF